MNAVQETPVIDVGPNSGNAGSRGRLRCRGGRFVEQRRIRHSTVRWLELDYTVGDPVPRLSGFESRPIFTLSQSAGRGQGEGRLQYSATARVTSPPSGDRTQDVEQEGAEVTEDFGFRLAAASATSLLTSFLVEATRVPFHALTRPDRVRSADSFTTKTRSHKDLRHFFVPLSLRGESTPGIRVPSHRSLRLWGLCPKTGTDP